jgi:hypothetical protein
MATKSELSQDLLFGAQAIATYLNWPRWRIYYLQNNLPISRIGQTLIARKSELDRALSGTAQLASKEVA